MKTKNNDSKLTKCNTVICTAGSDNKTVLWIVRCYHDFLSNKIEKNLVDRKHGRKSDNRKTWDAVIIWTMSAIVWQRSAKAVTCTNQSTHIGGLPWVARQWRRGRMMTRCITENDKSHENELWHS